MNALCTSGSLAAGTLVEFTCAAYTYLCVCAYVHICLHTVVKGTYAYTVRNKSVYVASCLDNFFSWCSL